MPEFIDMDRTVTLADQVKDAGGPLVPIKTFVIQAADADRLVSPRTADASIMQRRPGFVSTELHRGIAGSGVLLEDAVRDSVTDFRAVDVPGICPA